MLTSIKFSYFNDVCGFFVPPCALRFVGLMCLLWYLLLWLAFSGKNIWIVLMKLWWFCKRGLREKPWEVRKRGRLGNQIRPRLAFQFLNDFFVTYCSWRELGSFPLYPGGTRTGPPPVPRIRSPALNRNWTASKIRLEFPGQDRYLPQRQGPRPKEILSCGSWDRSRR